MKEIMSLREEINKIDEQMAILFEKRMDLVKEIGNLKKSLDLPIMDPIREDEVIKKNICKIENEEYRVYYHDYMEMLMEISKVFQSSL
ncbi:MAG: chorismate mutase [Anaerorhabdus sp.]